MPLGNPIISLFMVRFAPSCSQIEASDYRENPPERLSLFRFFSKGWKKKIFIFPTLGKKEKRVSKGWKPRRSWMVCFFQCLEKGETRRTINALCTKIVASYIPF